MTSVAPVPHTFRVPCSPVPFFPDDLPGPQAFRRFLALLGSLLVVPHNRLAPLATLGSGLHIFGGPCTVRIRSSILGLPIAPRHRRPPRFPPKRPTNTVPDFPASF